MMSTAALLTATEKSLEQIETKLAEAQEVARANQLAWTDSEAAVMELQTEAGQIRAAIRALKGEAPEEPSAVSDVQPESGDSDAPPDETGDEFEQRIARERVAKQKAKEQTGPYAGMACSSCGGVGTLYDSLKNMKGRNVPIIACENCASVRMR
jgi:hypothetical protein